MADHCQQCGAVLARGMRFCGTCGAAAVGSAQGRSSATAAWTVAVVAVGLLGAAITYILVGRDTTVDPQTVAAAADTVDDTAVPDGAPASAPVETKAPVAVPPPPAASPAASAIAPARTDSAGGAQLIGRYRAWIGNHDRFASDGFPLNQPWQVLRQDRANVHRYGIVDPRDEGDPFFGSANNRAIMERMVMNGRIEPAAGRRIVAGGVMVTVSIYGRGSSGDYVNVQVD